MNKKEVFAVVPSAEIQYRISQSCIATVLGVSKRFAAQLAAAGHFGEGITYVDGGHRYYLLDKVHEFQRLREVANNRKADSHNMAKALADDLYVRIPTIPPSCSEGRRPVFPKESAL